MNKTIGEFKQLFSCQEKLGTVIDLNGFVRDIDERVLAFVKESTKKVKFVADFEIKKVEVDQDEQRFLDSQGLYNYIVHANAVIDARYTVQSHGHYARSSYLKDFHLNCIFETANTLYVLCRVKKPN